MNKIKNYHQELNKTLENLSASWSLVLSNISKYVNKNYKVCLRKEPLERAPWILRTNPKLITHQ